MDSELLKEYQERSIRWAEQFRAQLSFYNNLLLTLSIGYLSFTYKPKAFENLHWTLSDEKTDFSLTFTVSSIWLVALTILLGLLLAINRLQDFKITKHINEVRKWMYEYSDRKMDQQSPAKFIWNKRLLLSFQTYPLIILEDCLNFNTASQENKDQLKHKFRSLRNIAYNLGLNTWTLTIIQTVAFGLSVCCYLIGIILK